MNGCSQLPQKTFVMVQIPNYNKTNVHIELLPPIRAGTHKPQLVQSHFANNKASTSAVSTQKRDFPTKQVTVKRNETVCRLQVGKRTIVCHRYNSCTLADSITSKLNCSRTGAECMPNLTNAVHEECLLKETNNLSVYKNNDCITLPTRRQQAPEPRQQCFFCGEWYCNTENTSGSCKEAPDPVERFIRFLTCYPIAQGAIYHCCKSDDDTSAKIGRFGQGYSVFSCGAPGMSSLKRLKRRLFVAFMMLVVPCLCCYFPAHLLNKCFGGGERGRHQPYPLSFISED